MKRFVLVAVAAAAFAGAAHATTDAGAVPAVRSEFVAMSNVALMAQRTSVPIGANVLFGNGRTPGFTVANEPGLTNSGLVQPNSNTGISPAAIPEPAAWMMLIAGFGLVGLVTRRRRSAVSA